MIKASMDRSRLENTVIYCLRVWLYSVLLATPIWFLFWNEDDTSLTILAPFAGLFSSLPALISFALLALVVENNFGYSSENVRKTIYSILSIVLNFLTFWYFVGNDFWVGFIIQSIFSTLFIWLFSTEEIGAFHKYCVIIFTAIIATVRIYWLASLWISG